MANVLLLNATYEPLSVLSVRRAAKLLWGFLRWVHDQADLNFCPSRFTPHELAEQGFRDLPRLGARGGFGSSGQPVVSVD